MNINERTFVGAAYNLRAQEGFGLPDISSLRATSLDDLFNQKIVKEAVLEAKKWAKSKGYLECSASEATEVMRATIDHYYESTLFHNPNTSEEYSKINTKQKDKMTYVFMKEMITIEEQRKNRGMKIWHFLLGAQNSITGNMANSQYIMQKKIQQQAQMHKLVGEEIISVFVAFKKPDHKSFVIKRFCNAILSKSKGKPSAEKSRDDWFERFDNAMEQALDTSTESFTDLLNTAEYRMMGE